MCYHHCYFYLSTISLIYFFFNDTATTEIYTYLTHSFPTRRSSDLLLHHVQLAPDRLHPRHGQTQSRHQGAVVAPKTLHRPFKTLGHDPHPLEQGDRKSTRLNSSH